ncbi:MAG TPA: hypothetical protein PKJ98_20995 [Verrucomicrobiota bacterium]|nr:hypothetical protein [Verrucomicrobiota bacterium]
MSANVLMSSTTWGAEATLLFEDDFDGGIPGWTAVQPPGTYIDGPLRWQYDIVSGAYVEQSNIYTDNAAASPTATAAMLINDAVAGPAFTFKARLVAGDDDGFGLIFGYHNPTNFYRVTFTRQVRTTAGFPWNGWNVDRKVDNVATPLFGDGTPGHVPSFVNIQALPFDVTISVTSDNRLTLVVVDDPDGGAVEYRLVEGQALPGSAQGQVGFMTWGMSGLVPRGFRIFNPQLSPVPLVSDPNALTRWTPVVTPRADGSGLDPATGNAGVPIWSLALGANGSYGTLHENSDSFGGNTADGVVDFPAASLVAGDPAWANYVCTARLIPADDDGQGMLLRYQDELNFYRIALRAQNSTAGVRRGLSVQKVVAGVWEEVFHETTAAFAPPSNVPYDLSAVIVGDRLQVQIVANPLGAAKVHSYGPIDFTGSTLANGRIGLFSWAMSRLEADFVRVHGIDGLPLQITSTYGNPVPASGLHGYPAGSSVTASVPSPIEQYPGVRRICTGWTGVGSVPATGSESSVTFTISDLSSLVWNWRTEVRMAVTAEPGGTVNAPAESWQAEGTVVAVAAQPNAGFMFAGWSGDVTSLDPTLDLTLNRPYTLEARFEADTDADGLPDSWEQSKLGRLTSGPDDDPDHDGKTNRVEYQTGSDPDFAEALLVSDGFGSRWVNVQRDPILPGQLVVRDFGGGFRGVWENSNDYRSADDATFIGADAVVPNVSFEGPRMVIRPEAWNPAWSDYTAQAIFSVGDNDGNCLYFRYRDEDNWYRVTMCGEYNIAAWRAPYGVSVQKRSSGLFSELAADPSIATDPTDGVWYKRFRIMVTAAGPDFEVRVTGWNALLGDWDTAWESVLTFQDTDHSTGAIGVGLWGQSGGATATATNPVDNGALIEDVVVTVGNQEVFREEWTAVPLADQLPAGWETPPGDGAPTAWQVTAHGTFLQTSNFGTTTTGTLIQPKANAEGTTLLAPPVASAQYYLELGFHPFDDDGIGFVYDYQDADNYARVLFVSETTADGRVPRGVNVSRKTHGAWSDLFVGDLGYVYTVGNPFAVTFANDNGQCRLVAYPIDDPTAIQTWTWTGPAGVAGNRFGLTCWAETDAHFLYARAHSLPPPDPVGDLEIAGARIVSGMLVLDILNPGGTAYDVENSPTLLPPAWTTVSTGQTGSQWSTPAEPGTNAGFYRLRRL